jgi:hypothetical protein
MTEAGIWTAVTKLSKFVDRLVVRIEQLERNERLERRIALLEEQVLPDGSAAVLSEARSVRISMTEAEECYHAEHRGGGKPWKPVFPT